MLQYYCKDTTFLNIDVNSITVTDSGNYENSAPGNAVDGEATV